MKQLREAWSSRISGFPKLGYLGIHWPWTGKACLLELRLLLTGWLAGAVSKESCHWLITAGFKLVLFGDYLLLCPQNSETFTQQIRTSHSHFHYWVRTMCQAICSVYYINVFNPHSILWSIYHYLQFSYDKQRA